jgi:hypothetical protein
MPLGAENDEPLTTSVAFVWTTVSYVSEGLVGLNGIGVILDKDKVHPTRWVSIPNLFQMKVM